MRHFLSTQPHCLQRFDLYPVSAKICPINVSLEGAFFNCPMVIFLRSRETTRSSSLCPADNAKANIVIYESNMEDYLLCHAAFVLPAAFACYYTDGNLRKLKGNTAYLNRILDANIEGNRAGFEIKE